MATREADAGTGPVRELVIERLVRAPRHLVYDAWTDPGQLARWWGPRGFTCPRCELDARPGGRLHVDMRSPDGVVYPLTGEVRELVAPGRLVLACVPHDGAGRPLGQVLHTVLLDAVDGTTTRVTISSRVLSLEPAAGEGLEDVDRGWSQSLFRLGDVVAEGTASDREILVSRHLYAPRERVWAAWTDPEQVGKWWGPDGFTITNEVMDVRVGGEWRLTMHGPDGTDYPNRSRFLEVVEPERIVFRHGGGRAGGRGASFVATWTFEEEDGGTRITGRLTFASPDERDRVAAEYGALEGGRQTLARLDAYLESTAAGAPAGRT